MTTLRPGDAPVDIDYRQRMNVVTSVPDQIFNGDKKGAEREIGFVLLVFDYGEKEGRCECVSNGAHPSDITTLFKEQMKRFDGQAEMTELA